MERLTAEGIDAFQRLYSMDNSDEIQDNGAVFLHLKLV